MENEALVGNTAANVMCSKLLALYKYKDTNYARTKVEMNLLISVLTRDKPGAIRGRRRKPGRRLSQQCPSPVTTITT